MTTAPQTTGLAALAERIELWPIDRLRPYERNPRTHSEAQVDQIAASMVEFGWPNAVLVDEQGWILAGHGGGWWRCPRLGCAGLRAGRKRIAVQPGWMSKSWPTPSRDRRQKRLQRRSSKLVSFCWREKT